MFGEMLYLFGKLLINMYLQTDSLLDIYIPHEVMNYVVFCVENTPKTPTVQRNKVPVLK